MATYKTTIICKNCKVENTVSITAGTKIDDFSSVTKCTNCGVILNDAYPEQCPNCSYVLKT